MVAHRLSTIREADCIVVMKDGEILEKGTHEELRDLKGQYYRMLQAQVVCYQYSDYHLSEKKRQSHI